MSYQTDLTGCDVSLRTAKACAQWDALQRAFLSHGAATPTLLGAVLEAEPDFAMGHAVKGLLYLSLGRSELRPTVLEALATARRCAEQGDTTAREREYIRALGHASMGHISKAAAVLDGVVLNYPGDALAMKLVQALRFMLGDAAGMRASIQIAKPGFGGTNPYRGFVLGCEAFALEETGDYSGAERAGRAGLELTPDDAWGLHAVAHVHDMTGRAADGVRWLAGKSAQWSHCNNFGYHVWWHLALFHLDRGAYGPVLELYDRKVRPTPTDDFRDVSNAASLLFRLEVEGVDVGARWEELAEIAANRIDDGALVFADLHYLMALAATDRGAELEAMTRRIAADAATLDHDQHEVSALTGLPMAQGLLAFRDGDYANASRTLQQGLAFLPRAGGSHAQRDVFWRLAIEASVRAGDCVRAEAMLTRRALDRGGEDGYTARRRDQIAARRADLAAAGIAAE